MFKKKNIFLIGPMGSGKSTIGRLLSKNLRMTFYDSDIEIEKITGADISWVFDVEGEKSFRVREERIINQLTENFGIVLATGGGSILCANSRKILMSRGIVIYLRTKVSNQFKRIRFDKKRPLLNNSSISKIKILKKLSDLRDPLYKNTSDIIIDTDLCSLKNVIWKILNILYSCFNI